MIGGILTYEILSGMKACGQVIGADGSGEFAVVLHGSAADAEQWARDHLRKIEASGGRLGKITFVPADELFTRKTIEVVTL